MTVFVCQLHLFLQCFRLIVFEVWLFFQLFFATLASITDFAVSIKDVGLDGAVVATAGGGGISLLFFWSMLKRMSNSLFITFRSFSSL